MSFGGGRLDRPLWTPSEERVRHANITRYRRWLRDERGLDLPGYRGMWEWSVDDRAAFWRSIWEFFGVLRSREPEMILENGEDMMASRWFIGARLNFAENLLRYALGRPVPHGLTAEGPPDGSEPPVTFDPASREALVFTAEPGWRCSVAYADLLDRVSRCAAALRAMGIRRGDRVAGFMPNMIETVVAMLAATSIGAIWSSCSPDFGVRGVVDRFGQIEPRVLFTADGYFYNGRRFDSLDRAREVLKHLPTIEKVLVVPYLARGENGTSEGRPDLSGLADAGHLDDFM
ncbi:MAG TPA: hypothetical protein EYP43_02600, partial [Thermoplasmata archaeon]|nr:hypothetical protein [Thermoplasmata archaeon]